MIIFITIMPIITLIVGFCFGFYIQKNNELPEIKTPKEIIEDKKEKIRVKENKADLDTYLENIDNYPNNQQDFKKG